jgi:hypothetical protein
VSEGSFQEVEALVQAGVTHVVVGLKHPIPALRGNGIHALQQAGIKVSGSGDEVRPLSSPVPPERQHDPPFPPSDSGTSWLLRCPCTLLCC